MDLQELSDRIEIANALTTYATCVDTKDWERWQTVFTPDADVDYTKSTPVRGTPAEVAATFRAAFERIDWAMHYVTNVDITFEGPDAAKVTAMFYNPCLLSGLGRTSYFGGYYHHDFVRTTDGWKSKHLVEEMLWRVNHPDDLAAEPSGGR